MDESLGRWTGGSTMGHGVGHKDAGAFKEKCHKLAI